MKRIFVAGAFALAVGGPALAADLPPPPAPPPRAPAAYIPAPVPIYSWTGIYVGANGGFGWNAGTYTDSLYGFSYSGTNMPGFIGGEIGANYQIYNFVLGLEADFDWALNQGNTTTVTSTSGTSIAATANNRWATLLDARVGYAFDRVLVFAKGGAAWVGASNPTFTNVATGASFSPALSGSNIGWTVGAGLEWAFWNNLSAKVEYDYIGLSNTSATLIVPAPGTGLATADTFNANSRSMQLVLLGLNYKFGW